MSEQNQSNQKMQDALKRTVRHVVETMCFSEVAPTNEVWQNAETIITAVHFYGSRTGRLKLEVSSSAAWSLRNAFLGQTEPSVKAEGGAGEMVGELGTMICGRFLSAVDPLSTMTLATPEMGQQRSEMEPCPQQVRQNFALQAGHLSASVEFDKEK